MHHFDDPNLSRDSTHTYGMVEESRDVLWWRYLGQEVKSVLGAKGPFDTWESCRRTFRSFLGTTFWTVKIVQISL